MISAKSYAKASLAASQSLATNERIGWLIALADRRAQRVVVSGLQQPSGSEALQKMGLPLPLQRFLGVLGSDGALRQLSAICQQVERLAFLQGIAVPVRLETARHIAADHLAQISTAIEQQASGPALLEVTVNPTVLGGVRAQIGGQSVDRTVRGALTALQSTLRHS